jgi:hypothetical protein
MLKLKHLDGALRQEQMQERAAWLAANGGRDAKACGCVGPQNGQPLCPCAMRGVVVKDGRYVRPEQDLGPAT